MEVCDLGSAFGGHWLQFPWQAPTMFAVSWHESGAKCSSYATASRTQLSSVVWQEKTNRGGSSSLNKNATRLPHGIWKANLVQTGSQAVERGLSASFQLKDSSCYRPGASSVVVYWAREESGSSSPSPTSTLSPIIPSEHTFSICVPFSLTYNDLSFCGALADWVFIGLWIKPTEQLYCIQLMQRLYSTVRSHLPSLSKTVSLLLICSTVSSLPSSSIRRFSAVSLFSSLLVLFFFLTLHFFSSSHFSFLPSLVFISLEHFTASTRACQLHTVVTASAPTTWQRGREIEGETERLTWNSPAHTVSGEEGMLNAWI